MRILIIILLLCQQLQEMKQPRLEDYYIRPVWKGKPAELQQFPVGLQHHNTSAKFRKALQKELMRGPNFADHYRIVLWLTDSACFEYAIVDLMTGKVYMPADNVGCVGLVFQRNSRLCIVDPIDSAYYERESGHIPDNIKTPFYVWDGDSLRQVYSTQKPLEFEYQKKLNLFYR